MIIVTCQSADIPRNEPLLLQDEAFEDVEQFCNRSDAVYRVTVSRRGCGLVRPHDAKVLLEKRIGGADNRDRQAVDVALQESGAEIDVESFRGVGKGWMRSRWCRRKEIG